MNKLIILTWIIMLSVLVACAPQVVYEDDGSSGLELESEEEKKPIGPNTIVIPEPEQVTSAVPAPGFDPEEVEEMIVRDNSDDEPSADESKITGSVVEIDVIARQWEFSPNPIRVKEGDTVRLNIQSLDVTHGFNLPAFGISERLVPENPITVEFLADQKGEYPFSCSVPCGAGHSSMNGMLIVE